MIVSICVVPVYMYVCIYVCMYTCMYTILSTRGSPTAGIMDTIIEHQLVLSTLVRPLSTDASRRSASVSDGVLRGGGLEDHPLPLSLEREARRLGSATWGIIEGA